MALRTPLEVENHLRQALDRVRRNTDGDRQVDRVRRNTDGDRQEQLEPINNEEDRAADRPPARRLHSPFPANGKTVYNNDLLSVSVQEIAHKNFSRFNIGDHLYAINFNVHKNKTPPLLLDIEEALNTALTSVLKRLKAAYSNREDFQVYVTIIGHGIKSGLNSGNYSLRSPPEKISRWVLSMLYNYLKSNQTLRLNKTFHVKVKVLSVEHTNDLIGRNSSFRKHVHH